MVAVIIIIEIIIITIHIYNIVFIIILAVQKKQQMSPHQMTTPTPLILTLQHFSEAKRLKWIALALVKLALEFHPIHQRTSI